MNTHPLTRLEASLRKDLEHLKTRLMEMADRAEHAHWDALKALKTRDRQLAYAVILRDQYIDELELALDRQCQEFLVRQQPAGAHLRFVFTAVKIIKELERVGDYAESIARQVLTLSTIHPLPPLDKVEALARLAIPMLHTAMRAVLEADAELARSTVEQEVMADKLRHEIDAELVSMRERNLFALEALTPLLTVVRRFERVSDQARNICEEALYMTTGEYVRHKGSDVFRILFLDDDSACLAPMAEAIGISLKTPTFVFVSAGMNAGVPDARVVAFMESKGCPLPAGVPRLLGSVPEMELMNVVIGLSPACHTAVPGTEAKTMGLEWPVSSPLQGTQDPAAAMEQTFSYLRDHIRDLIQAIQGEYQRTEA